MLSSRIDIIQKMVLNHLYHEVDNPIIAHGHSYLQFQKWDYFCPGHCWNTFCHCSFYEKNSCFNFWQNWVHNMLDYRYLRLLFGYFKTSLHSIRRYWHALHLYFTGMPHFCTVHHLSQNNKRVLHQNQKAIQENWKKGWLKWGCAR